MKRLKQPKYLLGALVGGAYVYFIFVRRFGTAHSQGMPTAAAGASLLGTLGAAAIVTLLLLNWTLPPGPRRRGASLTFSEAEIAFLFPAPIGRYALVHYRMLSHLLALLLGSMVLALVSNRWAWLQGNPATHVLGWWIILAVLSMHGTASAFVIAHLKTRGMPPWATRLTVLAVLLALFGLALHQHGHTELLTAELIPQYLSSLAALVTSGPVSWVLAAAQPVLAPFLAANLHAFVLALPAALAVLVAHYVWVLLVAVNFEEASIARAEKRAARRRAIRSSGSRGTGVPLKARRARFQLRSTGRPEIAFLWKNLLAAPAFFSPRTAVLAAVVITGGCFFLSSQPQPLYRAFLPGVTATAIPIIAYTVLFGPQLVRYDLRGDLMNADLLNSYPLRGWQIVLGELLAPVVILTTVTWLALLGLLLSQQWGPAPPPWPLAVKLSIAAGLMLFAPLLCALQLLMPNGVAVLLPAWSQSVRTEQGLEVMGQRLISLLLQLLVTTLFLVPAGIGAALVYFGAGLFTGQLPAALAAGVVAFALLLAELGFAIGWLGERFERLDISAELRV